MKINWILGKKTKSVITKFSVIVSKFKFWNVKLNINKLIKWTYNLRIKNKFLSAIRGKRVFLYIKEKF